MTPMNVFVTEGNVDIYLSQLHETWNPEDRGKLLQLLIREEAQMGTSREHLEHGERRVSEGRQRVARQRQIVAGNRSSDQPGSRAMLILETLEQTQALLEGHLIALRRRRECTKL